MDISFLCLLQKEQTNQKKIRFKTKEYLNMLCQKIWQSRTFILNSNIPGTVQKLYQNLHYVQGQEPEPKVREYFYYIDHQGMLFLDDAKMKNFTSCFKEKKFLNFFFKRIRQNNTGRYEEFPFISLCGKERNYIRCDDVPVVYTHIITKDNLDILTYGYAGDSLTSQFKPNQIYMLPASGRVYHPADKIYGGIGLVRSKLAIELSKNFEFQKGDTQPPTHFIWKNEIYELDQQWLHENIEKYKIKVKTDPD